MATLRATHALVFLMAAVLAFGFGLQTNFPWAAAGVALLLATRTIRSLVLERGMRREKAEVHLVAGNIWRPVALAYLAAAGSFLVSVVLGETWWSVLGVGWGVGFGLMWLQMGRRGLRTSTD